MCRFPTTRTREGCVVESQQIEEDQAVCDGPTVSDADPSLGHELDDEVDSEIEPQHQHGNSKILSDDEIVSDDEDDSSDDEG
jgi:hypothetical protein